MGGGGEKLMGPLGIFFLLDYQPRAALLHGDFCGDWESGYTR